MATASDLCLALSLNFHQSQRSARRAMVGGWRTFRELGELCSQGLHPVATLALGRALCPARCRTGHNSSLVSWTASADQAACCTSCRPGVSAGGFPTSRERRGLAASPGVMQPGSLGSLPCPGRGHLPPPCVCSNFCCSDPACSPRQYLRKPSLRKDSFSGAEVSHSGRGKALPFTN